MYIQVYGGRGEEGGRKEGRVCHHARFALCGSVFWSAFKGNFRRCEGRDCTALDQILAAVSINLPWTLREAVESHSATSTDWTAFLDLATRESRKAPGPSTNIWWLKV